MMSRKMQQKAIILANLEASWIMTFAMVEQQKIMALEMLQGIHLIIHRLEAICLRRKSRKHWKLAMICPNHLLINQCGQGLQL